MMKSRGYEMARERYLSSVRDQGSSPGYVRAQTDQFVLLTRRDAMLRAGAPAHEIAKLDKPIEYLRETIRAYRAREVRYFKDRNKRKPVYRD